MTSRPVQRVGTPTCHTHSLQTLGRQCVENTLAPQSGGANMSGAASPPGPCPQLGACMAGGGAQMTHPAGRSAKTPPSSPQAVPAPGVPGLLQGASSFFFVCFHLFQLQSPVLLSFVWPLVLSLLRLPWSSSSHGGMFWNVLSPDPPIPISQMQACATVEFCPPPTHSPLLCWAWRPVAARI